MLPSPKRKVYLIKDTLKVPVPVQQPSVSELKIGLGELGFDEKISKSHIDLGVVAAAIQ